MENRENSSSDPIDFWNLSDLIPPTKKASGASAPRGSQPVFGTEIIVSGSAKRSDFGDEAEDTGDIPLTRRDVRPQDAASIMREPEFSYRPNSALLHEVRVYPWRTSYSYYESFCRHALRLADKEGEPCPIADFFSYIPQYTQMSREQLATYLWWRTDFRRGGCLDVPYSYLLLFLFELINLDGVPDPACGQAEMLRLWLCYRERHPRLDVLIREWLCDYSLLHRLSAPRLPETQFKDLISGCRLKEFYIAQDIGNDEMTDAVLYFCSNYDYRKSKFRKTGNEELFDRVIRGAVVQTLRFVRERQNSLPSRSNFSTISRDTYQGALCSCRLKRKVEVDFVSFSHTHEMRYIITDVLKYAENAVRAYLGVKSRLTVYEIGGELREMLDGYLKQAFPERPGRKASEAPADYEKMYDLPVRPISRERAAQIESESWLTTEKLISAFAPEEEQNFSRNDGENSGIRNAAAWDNTKMPANGMEIQANGEKMTFAGSNLSGNGEKISESFAERMENTCPNEEKRNTFADILGELAEFVRLAASKDAAGQRTFALSKSTMPDALADRINTAAGDFLGDIILEDAGGHYTVIEDYKELLKKEGVL